MWCLRRRLKINNYRTEMETSKKTKFTTYMKTILKNNNIKLTYKKLDWTIISIVFMLILLGLVMVYSATLYYNPLNSLKTQLVSVFLGIIAINVLLIVPYELFENIKLIAWIMLGVDILLFITWAIAEVVSGAASWIEIFGFSFQPSELVKILSVLIVSWLINYTEREVVLPFKKLPNSIHAVLLLLLGIGLFFILIQPDIGMVAIIAATIYLIFMLTKASFMSNILSYAVIITSYIAVVNIAGWIGDWLVSTNWHFFERIAAFVDPFRYSHDPGYQLIQGFLAFSRGGWFGMGLGQGIAKEGYLPAIETDFILAHIGEEIGFIGVMFVILMLFALIIILYQRAAASKHVYRRSVIVGIASLLLVQVLINIGGVASILPLTGVTLPLISYGGTSMIVTLAGIGIALRMIAEDRKQPNINLVYSRKKGSSVDSGID